MNSVIGPARLADDAGRRRHERGQPLGGVELPDERPRKRDAQRIDKGAIDLLALPRALELADDCGANLLLIGRSVSLSDHMLDPAQATHRLKWPVPNA